MFGRHSLAHVVRRFRLLHAAYYAVFQVDYLKRYRENRRFLRANPACVAPPARLIFKTTGLTDFERFFVEGEKQAREFYAILTSVLPAGPLRICEWGCGAARLIRHFPTIDPARRVDAYGTDYDRELLDWCVEHIKNVTFRLNKLTPPLPFPTGWFDAVYSSSVLTHLPAELHRRWLDENVRVVKPGGVVLLTVNGRRFKQRLLPAELEEYETTGVVVRGGMKAGGPWFTAYHNPTFVEEKLLRGFEIIYKKTFAEDEPRPRQDRWVIRREA